MRAVDHVDRAMGMLARDAGSFSGAGYTENHEVKVGGNVVGHVAKAEGRVRPLNEGGGREPGTWTAFRADGSRINRGHKTRAYATAEVKSAAGAHGDAQYAPGSKGTSRIREVGGKYVVEINHGTGWENLDGVDYKTEAKAKAAQQLWVKYGIRPV